MIAIASCLLILVLLILAVRWVAAAPLFRTLSIAIDSWADGVHGADAERQR